MKNTDIISRIENLSLYFSSFEQEIKNINDTLKIIANEIKNINNIIGKNIGKENNS